MDWLEERIEGLQRRIRNYSFRKAMIAYILVLAVIVAALSYLTMIVCWQLELAEWARYEQEDFSGLIWEKGLFWADGYHFAEDTDAFQLLFLDMVRVWCPFVYAFAGMIVTIGIFYQKRLAKPLSILEDSVARIRENNLDFHAYYDSRDELGSLLRTIFVRRLRYCAAIRIFWRDIFRREKSAKKKCRTYWR